VDLKGQTAGLVFGPYAGLSVPGADATTRGGREQAPAQARGGGDSRAVWRCVSRRVRGGARMLCWQGHALRAVAPAWGDARARRETKPRAALTTPFTEHTHTTISEGIGEDKPPCKLVPCQRACRAR
jgi:hypothetical protein